VNLVRIPSGWPNSVSIARRPSGMDDTLRCFDLTKRRNPHPKSKNAANRSRYVRPSRKGSTRDGSRRVNGFDYESSFYTASI